MASSPGATGDPDGFAGHRRDRRVVAGLIEQVALTARAQARARVGTRAPGRDVNETP